MTTWHRIAAITATGIALSILLACAGLGYLGGDPFRTTIPAHYQPRAGAPAAIALSGDMGFSVGIGPRVTRRLAQDGVPVVGINSLSFFRTTRRPHEVTALIEDAMRRALAINPRGRLVLIGQSYGADMMHVGLAGLPAAERNRIALVALVVPETDVEFRASPSELLTFLVAAHDALPTARRLDWVPLLCIRGEKETRSLCPLLRQTNARIAVLPGGHPLRGDDAAVYREIRAAMLAASLASGG